MNKKGSEEEKLSYLNSLGEELTPEVLDRLDYLESSRKGVWPLKKTTDVTSKAEYIKQKLDSMDTEEEKLEYLDKLEEEGMLTDSVRDELYKLNSK
jgi:hypothetical protein